jgi:hypothetical protein
MTGSEAVGLVLKKVRELSNLSQEDAGSLMEPPATQQAIEAWDISAFPCSSTYRTVKFICQTAGNMRTDIQMLSTSLDQKERDITEIKGLLKDILCKLPERRDW